MPTVAMRWVVGPDEVASAERNSPSSQRARVCIVAVRDGIATSRGTVRKRRIERQPEGNNVATPRRVIYRVTTRIAGALIRAITLSPSRRASSSLACLVMTATRRKPQSSVTRTSAPSGCMDVTREDR